MDSEPSQQELAAALAALQAKIVEFNAALSAAGNPEIVFPPFPDLVENPNNACLLNWVVVYTILIGDYIQCLQNHSGDPPAIQACVDAAFATNTANLIPSCLVQS